MNDKGNKNDDEKSDQILYFILFAIAYGIFVFIFVAEDSDDFVASMLARFGLLAVGLVIIGILYVIYKVSGKEKRDKEEEKARIAASRKLKKEHKKKMKDAINNFLKSCTKSSKGQYAEFTLLCKAYETWAGQHKQPYLEQKQLIRIMKGYGYKRVKKGKTIYFKGLELTNPP